MKRIRAATSSIAEMVSVFGQSRNQQGEGFGLGLHPNQIRSYYLKR
jgi:hypothetical protein